ncbi:hypothetical protein HPB52_013542 [Rhipicephalus sanguineus]|uniref:Uncharacterized protein n=1 Tax=Rhipicephalus sanguineus TaxID=34632 RepID=A0A9D4SQG1_RHISA|nr:hypothetical protein HPB52_013542 [Rhipicephalus sanguineus]
MPPTGQLKVYAKPSNGASKREAFDGTSLTVRTDNRDEGQFGSITGNGRCVCASPEAPSVRPLHSRQVQLNSTQLLYPSRKAATYCAANGVVVTVLDCGRWPAALVWEAGTSAKKAAEAEAINDEEERVALCGQEYFMKDEAKHKGNGEAAGRAAGADEMDAEEDSAAGGQADAGREA